MSLSHFFHFRELKFEFLSFWNKFVNALCIQEKKTIHKKKHLFFSLKLKKKKLNNPLSSSSSHLIFSPTPLLSIFSMFGVRSRALAPSLSKSYSCCSASSNVSAFLTSNHCTWGGGGHARSCCSDMVSSNLLSLSVDFGRDPFFNFLLFPLLFSKIF